MNNNELNDYVNELMLSNPVVDLDQSGTSEKSVIISYDDARDEFNRRRNDSGSASDGADMLQTAGRIDVSLQSFLRMQIRDSLFTSREIKCLNRIIEHIDERGYLSETPHEMSALLHISESEYLKLLHVVQGLEPAGVAARDLSECLLLQLRRLDAEAPLAETIVRKYLAELGANKLPRIAQLCGVTVEEVAAARELIRSLRPSPVSDLVNVETGFIIPDIVVTETPGGFDLRIGRPHLCGRPLLQGCRARPVRLRGQGLYRQLLPRGARRAARHRAAQRHPAQHLQIAARQAAGLLPVRQALAAHAPSIGYFRRARPARVHGQPRHQGQKPAVPVGHLPAEVFLLRQPGRELPAGPGGSAGADKAAHRGGAAFRPALGSEACGRGLPPRHRDIPPHRHQIPARHGHRALPRRGRNINNIRGPGQLQGPGSAKT